MEEQPKPEELNGAAPPTTSAEQLLAVFQQCTQETAAAIASLYPRTYLGDRKKPQQQQIDYLESRFNSALGCDRATNINAVLLGMQLTALANIVEAMFNIMFKEIPDGPEKPDFGISYKNERMKQFNALRQQIAEKASSILVPQGNA